MIAERIHLEHIPRILSNKPLLEHFLGALLDKKVQLPCWPDDTGCHCREDMDAGRPAAVV